MFRKILIVAVVISGLTFAAVPGPAEAHNAGHIILPSGECLNVGAGNSVLLPPSAQANTNGNGELDLKPGTSGDEFGARWAAEQGNSRMLPGHC